VQEVKRER